jgi:hypothetical protein
MSHLIAVHELIPEEPPRRSPVSKVTILCRAIDGRRLR